MKPRDASRRKTAPKKATARRVAARSVRGTVVGIAALLVASGIAYAGYREAGDPRFALGTIAVEGQLHTSASAVRAAAGIAPHTNVWLLDAGAAQRRIESLPWVASASVIRGWPNTITVDIVERTPVAAVALPDGGNAEEPYPQIALVDATMRVLSVGAPDPLAASLPLLRIAPRPDDVVAGRDESGTGIADAYDALVQVRALGLKVVAVDVAPATGYTIEEQDGIRVIFGSEDDLARKVELFDAIEPKITSPEDVVYVDLRSVRAPTVLYR